MTLLILLPSSHGGVTLKDGELDGLTRRLAMLQLAGLRAAWGQAENPLTNLRSGHPRVLWSAPDLAHIKETPLGRKCLLDLEREADRLQNVPPVDYKLTAGRLLPQSRRLLDRVYTLGVLFRLEGKEAYRERLIRELHAAAEFKDWNPGNLLDTAEITHAVAVGYDWLYQALTEDERSLLRVALVEKGLTPGLYGYGIPASPMNGRASFSLLSNCGFSLGALALGEEQPEISRAVAKAAIDSIPKALSGFTGDGGWSEAAGSWETAIHYTAILLSALENALGTDFGLSNHAGLARAGRFRIYLAGPMNRAFNYGDAGEEIGEEPAMFWLARRFGQPAYSFQQLRLLERARLCDPLNLVWLQRDSRPPSGPQWPLDQIFPSVQCAVFRSAWEDPSALFLAAKGGESKATRTRSDLGGFVFDAGGIRWASDLGPQSGKAGTEFHNTPLVDGENQDGKAESRVVRHEFGADSSWAQFDLTRAYAGRVKSAQRRIGMLNRQAVLVEDMIQADQPAEVLWGMMTTADISLEGNSAVLTKGGWTLAAEIHTPRHAVFDVVTVNTVYRRLVVRIGERVTNLDLSVLLTPHRTGQAKPKITARFSA